MAGGDVQGLATCWPGLCLRFGLRTASATLLTALVLSLNGCGDDQPSADATFAAAHSPMTIADRINSSELGLSLAIPRTLYVSARSPEDHELRLAGRSGENKSLVGRLTLITREGREAVIRDAQAAIDATWQRTLNAEGLGGSPEFQPQVVPGFHADNQHGLTIIKRRMVMVKALPTERSAALLEGDTNDVRVLALAYIVTIAPPPADPNLPAPPVTAGAPVAKDKCLVAVFVLENTPAAESMVDNLIESVRFFQ